MPVTIKPSDLAAEAFKTAAYEEPIANAAEFLQFSCPKEHENVKNGRIFHSLFDKLSKEDGIFECSNSLYSLAAFSLPTFLMFMYMQMEMR